MLYELRFEKFQNNKLMYVRVSEALMNLYSSWSYNNEGLHAKKRNA